MSFSQGATWKALINTYIGTIPLSADIGDTAEHIMSGAPPPRTPESAAMKAKLGAAPSDSQSAARRAASLSPREATFGKEGMLCVMIVDRLLMLWRLLVVK
jgi:hypothetical protein